MADKDTRGIPIDEGWHAPQRRDTSMGVEDPYVVIRELRSEIMALKERVSKTEWKDADHDAKLRDGAGTFAALRDDISKLGPKPVQVTKLLALVLSIAAVLIAWVWQAARYPDRVEFMNAVREASEERKGLTDQVQDMSRTQAVMQNDLRDVQADVDKLQAAPAPKPRK